MELTLLQGGTAHLDGVAGTAYRVERLGEATFHNVSQPEWQALHERLTPRTPFTSPLWNRLWWKHFQNVASWRRNELFVHTVRDAANRLIAVAPMMLTVGPRNTPWKIRAVRCFGTDPNMTEIRSIICAPEDEPRAVEALGHEFARAGRLDWIEWGALRQRNWRDALQRVPAGSLRPDMSVVDYHLVLPDSWEEFRSSRSRNVKESIRKCYNSLARDGLKPELEVVSAPHDCDAATRAFLTLHAERSRAAGVPQHSDVFASEPAQAFLFDYVRAMAQADQLRIFRLRVGGRVVATRIGFALADELYLYYSGYETAWARYSVMTTLVVEAFKWAIAHGFRVVNLSTGTDVSKLRWAPLATEYCNAVQVGSGVRSRLSLAALDWAKSRRRRVVAETHGGQPTDLANPADPSTSIAR